MTQITKNNDRPLTPTKELIVQKLTKLYQVCLAQENFSVALRIVHLQARLLGYLDKQKSDREVFLTAERLAKMDMEQLAGIIQEAQKLFTNKML